MRISSVAQMTADPNTAYAAFHDPRILADTIPGVEGFTPVDDQTYNVVLTMGVAAIKGTYKGSVAFSQEQPPASFVLTAKGSGGPGTIGADITVALAPGEAGGTEVTWAADAIHDGVEEPAVAATADAPEVLAVPTAPAALAAPAGPATPVAEPAGSVHGTSVRGSEFLAGAAVGAGAALLGVCVGLLAGRR